MLALKRIPAGVWIVALAVALRLVYGRAHLGYDAAWALVWGEQVLRGEVPSFEAPVAPTPHPLANAVSVLAALVPGAASTVICALAWLAFAGLGWAVLMLGRERFGLGAGVIGAAVVLTRPLLVVETQQAIVDVPFLALVAAAAVQETRHPLTGLRVPVLLALAGLLRPEAWVVAGAWWLYRARARGWRTAIPHAAIVATAPVLWALWDLAVTGDPLWSLHGTQDLAAQLERPRDADTALAAAPAYLRYALGDPVVWIGFAGAAAALVWRFEAAVLPGAIVLIGLACFLVLGVAGLPLLVRYLLLPAVMLALFAGVALTGWASLPRGAAVRVPWLVASTGLAVLLGASAVDQYRAVDGATAFSGDRAEVQDELTDIAGAREVRAARRACRGLWIPDHRPRPVLALALDRPPGALRVVSGGGAPEGLYLAYANGVAARLYAVSTEAPRLRPGTLPAGVEAVGLNRSWVAGARCAGVD